MGIKEILDFVKIEHMLFSLPFVLIGFVLADNDAALESVVSSLAQFFHGDLRRLQ